MKRLGILLGLSLVLFSTPLFSQGRYGKDSAECVKYLSFYVEYVKQKNYNEAAPLWRQAFNICPPQASQNMLVHGQQIMRHYIGIYANNPVRKKEMVDTLMNLYTLRAEYFANTPKNNIVRIRIDQATDMMNYYGGDEIDVFKSLDQAIEVGKEQTTIPILVRYMDYAGKLYNAGKIGEEDVMNAFEKAIATIEMIEVAKPSQQVTDAKKDIESLFIDSGVANCDNLVALYTPRLNDNPDDINLVKKIVALLSITEGGLDTDLFYRAVESLYAKEPSHKTAFMLYQMYAMRNNYQEAIKYLQEAVNFEGSTDVEKGDFYFTMATVYYKNLNNNVEAVNNAKKAIQASDSAKGKAYFLIGTIWASLQCSGNDIETRAKFWVSTDYMNKAKSADASFVKEANEQIAVYSKYYPLQSEAFMYDVLDGSSYTVSCGGLRETTTVRTQK